jgi:hypothetical protein
MPKRPVGKDAPHQAVRNALIAATRENSDCYLAATTLDLENLGRQHLAPEAYTRLGRRTAQTVLYILGKAAYHRGPYVATALARNETTIELLVAHRGGSDFGPEKNISGFSAFHGETPLEIESVRRTAPARIEVILARPMVLPLRLDYLYGAMPDSSRAVRDNSALQLPMEPFETILERQSGFENPPKTSDPG